MKSFSLNKYGGVCVRTQSEIIADVCHMYILSQVMYVYPIMCGLSLATTTLIKLNVP